MAVTDAQKSVLCGVCGFHIRPIIDQKGTEPYREIWVHNDYRYDTWKSPIHAATPKENTDG